MKAPKVHRNWTRRFVVGWTHVICDCDSKHEKSHRGLPERQLTSSHRYSVRGWFLTPAVSTLHRMGSSLVCLSSDRKHVPVWFSLLLCSVWHQICGVYLLRAWMNEWISEWVTAFQVVEELPWTFICSFPVRVTKQLQRARCPVLNFLEMALFLVNNQSTYCAQQ
jgi:hypothetical protein